MTEEISAKIKYQKPFAEKLQNNIKTITVPCSHFPSQGSNHATRDSGTWHKREKKKDT